MLQKSGHQTTETFEWKRKPSLGIFFPLFFVDPIPHTVDPYYHKHVSKLFQNYWLNTH